MSRARDRGDMRDGWLIAGLALMLAVGCSKKEPAASTGSRWLQFSKVPLEVAVPTEWVQTQNTTQWIVHRPSNDGVFVAMSGEKSCSEVEKRLYTAMVELGLSKVVWSRSPHVTQLGGLRTTVSEGSAIESGNQSVLKYTLTRAPANRGCLLTLYVLWDSRLEQHRPTAESIIMSVRSGT